MYALEKERAPLFWPGVEYFERAAWLRDINIHEATIFD